MVKGSTASREIHYDTLEKRFHVFDATEESAELIDRVRLALKLLEKQRHLIMLRDEESM